MNRRFVLGIILYLSLSNAWSFKSTTIGEVYPIVEQDLITYFQSQAVKKRADIDKLNEGLRQKTKEYLESPRVYRHIPETEKNRTRMMNPGFHVPKTITDINGRIIAKKGEFINPLLIRRPSTDLIYLNANSEKQVSWLKRYLKDHSSNKVILTEGKPIKLSKEIGQAVYFEQDGALLNKFKISAVPTVITTSGADFKIIEYAP